MTTSLPKVPRFLILLLLFALPTASFAEGSFLSGTVTEGFRGLQWGSTPGEALKVIPDLYFDHYALPAGDKTPSKIYCRKNEDRKIGLVTFRKVEYWFKEDSFYKITACLDSHYGPRTLVTDAERDFGKLREEMNLHYGEPVKLKTGLGVTDFDKYASWHIGRTVVSLSYKETGGSVSELYLEIKFE